MTKKGRFIQRNALFYIFIGRILDTYKKEQQKYTVITKGREARMTDSLKTQLYNKIAEKHDRMMDMFKYLHI